MNDRQHILTLIPHAGRMCLLDSIQHWSDSAIVCVTASHRDPENPLRRQGQLAALHLAEYGAQAMAVHGGLLAAKAGGRAAPGMLVSLRNIQLEVERLDDRDGMLAITATRLVADAGGWMYQFEAWVADQHLGSGRVAVIAVAEGA
jgi:predicted hotdog family 3-hydroxylacyl-ACP dehydratase